MTSLYSLDFLTIWWAQYPKKGKQGRSYIAFSSLILRVTHHFHCILFVEAITKTHPGSWGGKIDYITGWGSVKILEKHVELEILFKPFF